MRISGLEMLYVIFGVLCLGVAAVIWLMFPSFTALKSGETTPNIVTAGTACGFAIAGGLSFVAAAIVHRSESHWD
jgi:hypothetical protein